MPVDRTVSIRGKRLFPLALGTGFGKDLAQDHADAVFDHYLACGGNLFDTSLVYYNAEDLLGNWMAARNNRDQVIIQAKGAHHEAHVKRVTPPCILEDLSITLKRLKTNYVDIYMLHRDDPDQPVGPIIDALNREIEKGVILELGCSNWAVPRIEEANAYAVSKGLSGFTVSSPSFSLAFPNAPHWENCVTACDAFSRRWYARTAMTMTAWAPLAQGFFNEKFTHPHTFDAGQWQSFLADPENREMVRLYYSERNFERKKRVAGLSALKGVSPVQLALSWVMNQRMPVYPVVGVRSVRELDELMTAVSLTLTQEEAAWLNLERECREIACRIGLGE
jgi:aryl-alcohol dehydrogenase-like predicted oxidoreductase